MPTAEYRIGIHRGTLCLKHGSPPVRISLGTNDRGLAEQRARKIWSARTAPFAGSERVSDLWIAYVHDRRSEIKDASRFPHTWKALEPHFGQVVGSTITADDCKAYAQSRKREGKADSTVRVELEYLRACLNFRYGKGMNKIWTPPASAPRDRSLTATEVDLLLHHVAAPHVRLFIIIAITTGARKGAILEFTWDRVDFKNGTVNFKPAGRHETNKHRVELPLSKRAKAALQEAAKGSVGESVIEFAGQPIKSVKKAIRLAAERSGVPCSPHVFRHTAGVWMAQANVPMQKIAQYLGHTRTETTERIYARYTPSFMKDAADALDW